MGLRSGQVREDEGVGEGMDSILHMLLWAMDIDSALLVMLGAKDCVHCIGGRLLSQASFFTAMHQLAQDEDAEVPDLVRDPEEIIRVQSSFRGLAQMVNSLCHNEKAMHLLS